MRILHITAGGDTGGGKSHIIGLLKALNNYVEVSLVCFLDGPVYYEALANGIDVKLVLQKKRYDLSVLKKINQIIDQGDYDFVHSHGSRANFMTAILKHKLDIPVITTIHSDFQLDFLGNIYKHLLYTNLNKLALRYFDYYIAISEDFRSMLLKRGFPSGRVFTVHNGIDLQEMEKQRPGMTKEEFCSAHGIICKDSDTLVGSMGRLHPVKGQEILLRAAPGVLEKYPETNFILAGEGEEKEVLQRLATGLKIRGKVHFSGYVENTADFYNAVDINVLPSKSESFPYVLLEGAWYKLPTVATAVGGIPELIQHGYNGYLFPPGNYKQLEFLLNQLIGDRELRQKLGDSLHQKVKENFSTQKMAHKHFEIYTQIKTMRK